MHNLALYLEIVESCGGESVQLGTKDRWSALERWRRVYARALHERTGKWQINGFDWHVFSFEHATAEEGSAALEDYRLQRASALLVLPEDGRLPAFQLNGEYGPRRATKHLGRAAGQGQERPPKRALDGAALPDFTGTALDVLVFPPDLAWTMAFTHEADASLEIGPFFALHPGDAS